jgi:hypothetical protein
MDCGEIHIISLLHHSNMVNIYIKKNNLRKQAIKNKQ